MPLQKIFTLIKIFHYILLFALVLNPVKAKHTRNLTLLNKLEAKLYHGQNFQRDSVLKRIQRLEIALFGVFETKDIPIRDRILKIENEIFAKEITYLNELREQSSKHAPRSNNYSTQNSQNLRIQEMRENRVYQRSLEEDRRVFSTVSPIIQNLMRSSINALF